MAIYVLFAALLVVGVYAFLAGQRAKAAQLKAEQMNDRLYSWGSETRTMMAELTKQIKRLDFELKRQAGEIVVTPGMRIADILAIHPRMKEVLAGLHLGGCSSCATSDEETLAATAASNGRDLEAILSEIRRFLESPDTYQPTLKPDGGESPSTGVLQISLPSRAASN